MENKITSRQNTIPVKVRNIQIGGNNQVIIQSMCDIKTSNINEVVKQINECTKLGAQMMRVSVLDQDDAKAIKEIKKNTTIPIVADIHFDTHLGILAIENGADKIRINPGNVGSDEKLKELIDCAKKYDVAIRIGVNKGSIAKDVANLDISEEEKLVLSAKKYIKKIEDLDFHKLVISVKASNPLLTIKAYTLMSKSTNYPLHIGVTESGYDEIGIIRSVSALSPLLLNGIGSTIRISLTHNPQKEVITCVRLLHDLGLYKNYPTIISCPTCGRCMVTNTSDIADKILNYLIEKKKYITVAVMGCIVNGIGEGKNADIGIAGGNGLFQIFAKGKVIKTVKQDEVLEELFKLIDEI